LRGGILALCCVEHGPSDLILLVISTQSKCRVLIPSRERNLFASTRTYTEILSMKHKLIALIFALTMMSWAQSTTPAPAPEQNSTPAKAKTTCSCCDKMASADHKDIAACMHHAGKHGKDMSCCSGKDAKDAASCCSGKDGKSCSKDDKASASCCDQSKAGEGEAMACCAKDGKDGPNGCCSGKQCGKHDHSDHPAPGN
jgi:hypothetical protein